MPNTTGVSGYNYVTQEPSIPHPRRQHMFRGDYRPTEHDSLAVKYQTFYTKQVGINVAGASARWGLVRQRYDFFVDIGKVDYTRILELVDDPRVLDRLLQQRRGRASRGRHGAARHSAQRRIRSWRGWGSSRRSTIRSA